MTRSEKRDKIRKTGRLRDDLAFPVPFGEDAKYLELAMQLLDQRNGDDNVVPIDRDRRSSQKHRLKKAS